MDGLWSSDVEEGKVGRFQPWVGHVTAYEWTIVRPARGDFQVNRYG